MKVEWLPEAERNLAAQFEWIAEHNPGAALDVGDAILAAVGRLADHPAIAWAGRVTGTRELVVVGTPYIVVYRIERSAVVVLRVLHGAQRWPQLKNLLAKRSGPKRPHRNAYASAPA